MERHDLDLDDACPNTGSTCFEPLTPVAFLRRSAVVHRDRTAVIDGDRRWTYGELWDRARRLAGLLRARGIEPGDRVAALGSNSQLLLLAHYAVPLAGAVLVPVNVRLAVAELTYIAGHSGARALLADRELAGLAAAVAAAASGAPEVLAEDDVEAALAAAPLWEEPVEDETRPLSINYTSGTTGRPKGVVYHHRGAYLQALAMAFHNGLRADSVFLWIVPMFHCHGWCLTWGVTAAGGTHLCQRKVDAAAIWRHIREHAVSHAAAAPTVLTAMAAHPDAAPPERPIAIVTGGSPPSPALLSRLAELRIDVTHAYGLTETFGPVMLCDWHPEWESLDAPERARLKARQGVGNVIAQQPRIVDAEGRDVPADGATAGELVLRGNDVMRGYFADPEATRDALVDGWFKTGDVGVMHPDGYVELRDRSKDVIISGGENIASVEVEQAIATFAGVLEVAVVGAPDERWGERPVAFVTVGSGVEIDPAELIAHVRGLIAPFKAPREVVVVDDLPRTATGKIQKFVLRERLWAGQKGKIGR